MKIKLVPFICILFLLYSCDRNKTNEKENFESAEIYSEPEPSKTIDWIDGNTYSYDYTEQISKLDSLGNEEIITVYKCNLPSVEGVDCEPKICKWCSRSIDATNVSLEEYPNLNWLRGKTDFNSMLGMLGIILGDNTYYDLKNNKVRTEWRTNCEYIGPENFCSKKCKFEYN